MLGSAFTGIHVAQASESQRPAGHPAPVTLFDSAFSRRTLRCARRHRAPPSSPLWPGPSRRVPSSSIPAAAARASAEPPGGKRSPSSRFPLAARRHRALPSPSAGPRFGPPLRPWCPLLALTLRLVGGLSQLGPAWLWLAGQGRSRKGEIYSAPEALETTNRYNENDGVSTRHGVQELAFGIVICFGHQLPGRD